MLSGMLINGIVRAHGDSRTGLVASLIAEYAVFLPVGIVLVRLLELGLTGIMLGHIGYWFAFLAIILRRRRILLRRDGTP